MVPGLDHVIVVWFVPSCCSDSATSAHLDGFYEVRINPYNHPMNQNVIEHFIYVKDKSLFHSEVVLGLNHVIVV